MTFKAEWEKAHTKHHLSDDLIRHMLATFYDEADIENFKIIEGGCANINVLVALKAPDTLPFVILRIYLRDPATAIKEKKIYEVLETKLSAAKKGFGGAHLPIPETYHIDTLQGYTFAITRHLQGISLRDFLLRPGKKSIGEIMYNVGQVLGTISRVSFEKTGFFDSNLQVRESMTRKKVMTFFEDCLNDKKVNVVLSKHNIEQIKKLFSRHETLLPDQGEKNLVHADFDPSNILVNKQDGNIEISGILDWEFSFSGSTLCDVASMLRYAHQMPPEYESSFLEGLTSCGYKLPPSWKTTINLLNILSLLDCLRRADLDKSPAQIKDIKELLVQFTNNKNH